MILDRNFPGGDCDNEPVTGYRVIYVWPDGRPEVRYSRPISDPDLLNQVRRLQERFGDECPYEIEWTHGPYESEWPYV